MFALDVDHVTRVVSPIIAQLELGQRPPATTRGVVLATPAANPAAGGGGKITSLALPGTVMEQTVEDSHLLRK